MELGAGSVVIATTWNFIYYETVTSISTKRHGLDRHFGDGYVI